MTNDDEKQAQKPKKATVWMPLYVGDYLADTGHLSTVEHGAYLILLMTAWQKDGELPNDSERLRRITRMERDDWTESEAVLREFFKPSDDGLTLRHERVDAELLRAKGLISQKSEAGKKSAASRKAKKGGNDAGVGEDRKINEESTGAQQSLNSRFNGTSADAQRNANHSPSHSPTATDTDVSAAVVRRDDALAAASPPTVRELLAAEGEVLPEPEPCQSDPAVVVSKLLRKLGVNSNPNQLRQSKCQRLLVASDQEITIAVQALRDQGTLSFGPVLIAEKLTDIALAGCAAVSASGNHASRMTQQHLDAAAKAKQLIFRGAA